MVPSAERPTCVLPTCSSSDSRQSHTRSKSHSSGGMGIGGDDAHIDPMIPFIYFQIQTLLRTHQLKHPWIMLLLKIKKNNNIYSSYIATVLILTVWMFHEVSGGIILGFGVLFALLLRVNGLALLLAKFGLHVFETHHHVPALLASLMRLSHVDIVFTG